MFKTAAGMLSVAADFTPDEKKGQGREWVQNQVFGLCNKLRNLGVEIKVESALRACGYELIRQVSTLNFKVFADLKLFGTAETLKSEGKILKEFRPDVLTVVCGCGVEAMSALRKELPETELIGITALTNLDDNQTARMYGSTVQESVIKFALMAKEAGLDGIVASPKEISLIRKNPKLSSLSVSTPGVKLGGSGRVGKGHNSSRIASPGYAVEAGAKRIIVGKAIIDCEYVSEAAEEVINEIMVGLTARRKPA
ncbi:MAG: orotidine 5'-phosphate decarboxylase / HUMPS family protein [Minisyncoccia bacterium]